MQEQPCLNCNLGTEGSQTATHPTAPVQTLGKVPIGPSFIRLNATAVDPHRITTNAELRRYQLRHYKEQPFLYRKDPVIRAVHKQTTEPVPVPPQNNDAVWPYYHELRKKHEPELQRVQNPSAHVPPRPKLATPCKSQHSKQQKPRIRPTLASKGHAIGAQMHIAELSAVYNQAQKPLWHMRRFQNVPSRTDHGWEGDSLQLMRGNAGEPCLIHENKPCKPDRPACFKRL